MARGESSTRRVEGDDSVAYRRATLNNDCDDIHEAVTLRLGQSLAQTRAGAAYPHEPDPT
jgi:hypothetical protein